MILPAADRLHHSQERMGKITLPFDVLKNLHDENPFLRSISLPLLNADTHLFWHSTIVATGYINLVKNLMEKKTLDGNYSVLYQGVLGALLHDIGKLGVVNGSIKNSLWVIDYVPDGFEISDSDKDQRPPEIVAITHEHPLIGEKTILKFVADGLIPESIGQQIAGQVLNHHRSDGTLRTSYPGRKIKNENRVQIAAELLTEMMDFTTAMLSKRPYRKALSMEKTISALRDFVDNDKYGLFDYILPVFQLSSTEELKSMLVEQIFIVLNELQPSINWEPAPAKLRILIGTSQETVIDLQIFFNQVWEKNEDEFEKMYEQEMKEGFQEVGR